MACDMGDKQHILAGFRLQVWSQIGRSMRQARGPFLPHPARGLWPMMRPEAVTDATRARPGRRGRPWATPESLQDRLNAVNDNDEQRFWPPAPRPFVLRL
eukprot:5713089-Prymnesium_polylepis.1